ncbi:MAG: tyrosine-type recombinase/integrase [Acidobacteriia bacterium]|nr:tyrosine-type recombinase/integrase [Terriglobia bacterium]
MNRFLPWRLAACGIFAVRPGLAQIKDGSIAVTYFTKDKIVMAADRRGTITGIGSPNDTECKVAVLGPDVVFNVTGMLNYTPSGPKDPVRRSVRGPRYVVKRGKTPVLKAAEARLLLDSIRTESIVGLRDRALIGMMCYTFARVSAVVHMKVEDYYQQGKRWWIRLPEKGGKRHEVPAHHNAESYIDAHLDAARIRQEKKGPLFRSVDRHKRLTLNPMTRTDVLRMIKRRALAAGLPYSTCCHTFRATGITAYLEQGGTIENAQAIAAHESPRTTKLYDHTGDEITLDEVERIAI